MGIPTLRLRADYLAIVTIAVAEVIRLVVRSVQVHETVRRQRRHQGLRQFVPTGRRQSRPQPGLDVRVLGVHVLGQRSLDADRRLVARRDLRRRRLAADAEPVGPRAQGDPRGRGRGAQPRQERLQLQDAGADLRRRDRHLRRDDPRARHGHRAARQLQPRPHLLHPHRPRARRRGQGVRLDRRADAVLGAARLHRQLPARARRRPTVRCGSATTIIDSTQVGQIVFMLDRPAARCC